MQLSEGEVIAFFLAERLVQEYANTPYGILLAGLFRKITAALPDEVTIDLSHLEQVYSVRSQRPTKGASRQEMRTLVCAQCHVEYYFQPKTNLLVYPWFKGLKADQIETYYDEIDFKDWTHKDSGAPMLKAQHPEFEMWSQGIHARSGVSCADCHVPYKREGAVKISDHHVRSPLLNLSRACQTCHHYPEDEIKARVMTIQSRTKALLERSEVGVKDLIDALKVAREKKIPETRITAAQALHRKTQWRLDFVMAENSMRFHAPQEAARLLGEAIDFARQGQIAMLKGD